MNAVEIYKMDMFKYWYVYKSLLNQKFFCFFLNSEALLYVQSGCRI